MSDANRKDSICTDISVVFCPKLNIFYCMVSLSFLLDPRHSGNIFYSIKFTHLLSRRNTHNMAGNIANRFSAYEFLLMKILPRTSSMLSFLGCLFIITTFSCYKSFRLNPINRIVFYASFGNAIGSICLGIGNIFIHTPNVVKCQLQACMIQTYVTFQVSQGYCPISIHAVLANTLI